MKKNGTKVEHFYNTHNYFSKFLKINCIKKTATIFFAHRIVPDYYLLKVTVGTKPDIYYGYLLVEPILVENVFGDEIIDGAKYTFNYGLKRDPKKE
jgi:hypothetical protein